MSETHTVLPAGHSFRSQAEFAKYAEKHVASKSKGQILQCFLNADMRYGHEGLETLAKSRHIDVTQLRPGQYVVFVNHAKDRIKVFATNNVVAYMKLAGGRKVDLRVIQEIPRAFNGTGSMSYDAALKTAVESALNRKGKTVTATDRSGANAH